MFKKSTLSTAILIAIGGGAFVGTSPAIAQQQTLQRVEITGSLIKRSVDDEGSLPITIIKADELRKAGVTSVEGIIQMLAFSQSSTSSINAIGSGTGGASYANLRGLGSNKTLVLLNGRRVAAFAFAVDGVDLNAIPFAVIERVEVLRDGASSIYGTDAVGGVINFITKTNYSGGNIAVEASAPKETGGKRHREAVTFGVGDLETNGHNFWLSADKQQSARIRAIDREFAKTGIIPEKGVNGNSPTTFPGNFSQASTNITGNKTAPGCAPPFSVVNPSNSSACVFDFSSTIDIVPDVEQNTVAARWNAKVGANSVLSTEIVKTSNRNVARVAADPVSGITIAPSNPFYPTNYPGIDNTKSVTAAWRMVPAGNRTNESVSGADRIVLNLSGEVAGFDYRAGYYYTRNDAYDGAVDGYVNAPFVRAQVAAGNLNPFAEANAAQLALIEQAKRRGVFVNAMGKTSGVDFKASTEWFAMGGGNAAYAVVAEMRQEVYQSDTNDDVVLAIPSAGRSPSHKGGKRDVAALAAELTLPFSKALEVSLSGRADKYSDFGTSFNPKIGVRFQPVSSLVFRGSANTGFKAPTLDDLYAAQTVTFASAPSNDPVLCPGGVVNTAAGGVTSRDCNSQVQVQQGGNTQLRPEKSKTFSLGVAFEPIKNLTMSADYFNIKVTDQINAPGQASIMANPTQYAANFVRCKQLPAAAKTELNRCLADNADSNAIAYIIALSDNLGILNTSGIDFNFGYSTSLGAMGQLAFNWDATWVESYEYQNTPTDAIKQNVGVYSDGSPIFRWKHSGSLTWSKGDWSSRLGVRHQTGYVDANAPSIVVGGPSFYGNVEAYTLVDISVSAKPIKGMNMTVGLKNAFDTKPSFSNQGDRSQRGYDPRYSDPYGRQLFVRGSYDF